MPVPRLIPITRLSYLPQYLHQRRPGAAQICYVAEPVADLLLAAQRFLRSASSPNRRYDLLVWDAYRAASTQRHIFDGYVDQLIRSAALTAEEATKAAARFVSPPGTVYPHGTGGAIDLTLIINDEEASMGTSFDAFEDEAATNWFSRNPPCNRHEEIVAANRELLRSAMAEGEFVPYPDEWWHFEWGTARWAEATRRPIELTSTLPSP